MDTIGIGEAAAKTGLSLDALRYYERLGLVRPARDSGGRRRYAEADLAWLGFVVKLRATGMPLADLQAYADLYVRGPGTFRARRGIVEAHERRLRDQLATLHDALGAVREKLAHYDALERAAHKETA